MLQCKLPQLDALMFHTHYSSVLIQTRCLCCVTWTKPSSYYREVASHTSYFKAQGYFSVSPQIRRHLSADASSYWGKCLSRATPYLHTAKAGIESMCCLGSVFAVSDKQWLWTLDLLIYPAPHWPDEWQRLLPTPVLGTLYHTINGCWINLHAWGLEPQHHRVVKVLCNFHIC